MRPNSKNQTHCQKRDDHIRLILDLIEKEPSLFEKYSFSSGTGEQYTIFEHSRLVLKTAEQFKAQLEPMITPLSWNNFRFFLALHDIGKGYAIQKHKGANSFLLKQKELEYTRDIINHLCEIYKFESYQINLFLSLLKFDSIGQLLQNKIRHQTAKKQIITAATTCCDQKFSITEFFNIFKAFHISDAASYPSLKLNCFSVKNGEISYQDIQLKKINKLEHEFHLITSGQELFKESHNLTLEKLIKNKNINRINAFINWKNCQFLTQNHQLSAVKKAYKIFSIKGSFLIYNLIRSNVKKEKMPLFIDQYMKAIDLDPSSLKSSAYEIPLQNIFKLCHYLENIPQGFSFAFKTLFYEVRAATYYYHTRYQSNAFLPIFFHGSQSISLADMNQKTGNHLMFSGLLSEINITPFSGAIDSGSSSLGINKYAISGTDIYSIFNAFNYSHKPLNTSSLKYLQDFIVHILQNKIYPSTLLSQYNSSVFPEKLVKFFHNIKVLRKQNTNEFDKLRPSLVLCMKIIQITRDIIIKSSPCRLGEIGTEKRTIKIIADQVGKDFKAFLLNQKSINELASQADISQLKNCINNIKFSDDFKLYLLKMIELYQTVSKLSQGKKLRSFSSDNIGIETTIPFISELQMLDNLKYIINKYEQNLLRTKKQFDYSKNQDWEEQKYYKDIEENVSSIYPEIMKFLNTKDHLESHIKNELLQKSFPITYTSSTIHPDFFKADECLVSQPLRLVDDIDCIFTLDKHTQELKGMLHQIGASHITIIPYEAMTDHKIKIPSIDFIGIKRLHKFHERTNQTTDKPPSAANRYTC